MIDEPPIVRFSVLLSHRGREAGGRERIAEFLDAHALKQTGGGLATLSFAGSPKSFTDAFGTEIGAERRAMRSPNAVGGGNRGGGPVNVPVPKQIESFVETISVTPLATGFAEEEED